MIGMTLTENGPDGATYRVVGEDRGRFILSRLDGHEPPFHATPDELAGRFNVAPEERTAPEPSPLTVEAFPGEVEGWTQIARTDAERRAAARKAEPEPTPEEVFAAAEPKPKPKGGRRGR